MKKLSIYFAAAICLTMAFSCKDDEETTSKPSLSGLYLDGGVEYVAQHGIQHYTIDLSSLKTSGDEMPATIGLYYKVNSSESVTLTEDVRLNPVTSFDYKADTLGNYSVNVYAYTPDESHYASTTSTSFKCIDPSKAITGLAVTPGSLGTYISISAGGLTWMAENLHETGSGLPYEGCEVMNTVFGRYYSYEEALTACPDGWRLPTAAEWDALGTDSAKLMADAYFLDTKLWPYTKEVKINNETGFNAIPVGYIDKASYYNSTVGLNEYAAFWTADPVDDTLANYRYIFASNPVVQQGRGSRTSLALTVRCVK